MKMQILDYSLCLIEYAASFLIVNTLLDKRFKNYLPLFLVIVTGATVAHLSYDMPLTIKSAINFIVFLIGFCVLYKDILFVKLSFISLFLFTISIIDIIFGNLFAFFMSEDFYNVFFADFGYRLISCLIIKVVDIGMLLFFQRLFKRVETDLKPKYWGLFSIVFIILLVITIIFLEFYSEMNQNKETIILFLFISLSFYIMSVIIVFFFTEICVGFQRDKKLFALEIKNSALEEALANQIRNSENLRKVRHDITKHTANAVALIERGKTDEATNLLRNAGDAIEKILPDYNINTGSNIIDAIISSKATTCKSKNIIFTYKIEPLEDIKIDTIDLSSLISNLLDNAIEAAQKIEKGYVRIEIFKYKAYYDIYVENSFVGKSSVLHSGLKLISTKANDTIHGFGTQIIDEIAQKYDGSSTWEIDGNIFKSNVLVKI